MTTASDRTQRRRQALAPLFPGLETRTAAAMLPSLEAYCRDAVQYLDWCGWDHTRALLPATLCAWQTHLVERTQLSPHTINSKIRSLTILVQACAGLGTLPSALAQAFDQIEPLPRTSLPDRLSPNSQLTYTPVQIRRLCQAPDHRTLLGLRDRALLLTLASSGVNRRELIQLTPADLIARQRGWGLRVKGHGQEGHSRLAPLSQEAHKWIHRWLGARASVLTAPWIFTTLRGKPMTTTAVWHTVTVYARQIGLPHLTPYSLRKFIAAQVSARYSPRQARLVLGHATARHPQQHYLLEELEEQLTDRLF